MPLISPSVTITDQTAFTPTGTWTTNTTYTGFESRINDSLHFFIRIDLTGAPTSATLTLDIPGGRTVDESKIVTSTFVGSGFGVDAGTGRTPLFIGYDTASNNIQVWGIATGAGSNNYVQLTQAAPWTWASGDAIFCEGWLPITGW